MMDRLDQLILSDERLDASVIAERTGVTARTVRRRRQALSEAGALVRRKTAEVARSRDVDRKHYRRGFEIRQTVRIAPRGAEERTGMGTTYGPADEAALRLMMQRVEDWAPHLGHAEVRIDLLMAFGPRGKGGELSGPALKQYGYPASAVVRIRPLRERSEGLGDVQIILDGDHWEGWGEARQAGVLDHELQHIEVITESDDETPKADDLGRPRLKLRRHDWMVGGFNAVVTRHKHDAPEAIAMRAAFRYVPGVMQLVLPGMGDGDA